MVPRQGLERTEVPVLLGVVELLKDPDDRARKALRG
jgi:hypothetical protein